MEKQKIHKDPAPRSADEDEEKDQTAYEDSWYRSLKALSERKPAENDEDVEQPED
jgi:hypothetical protein